MSRRPTISSRHDRVSSSSSTSTILLGVLTWAWLFATSCVSYPRLAQPPVATPTPGPSEHVQWIDADDDIRLYASMTVPPDEPRGCIFFVLGPEIASRHPYPRLASALARSGYAMATIHPRGSGYSTGVRGDVDDYDSFVDDLRRGVTWARAAIPDRPMFLFGHSAGAALALELAATIQPPVDGIILVNPPYRLRKSEGLRPSTGEYLRFIGRYLFRRRALTVDMNSRPDAVAFAPDREEAQAMQRDPLVVRYFSMRFLAAHRRLLRRAPSNARRFRGPLLLIAGAHDALVDPRGHDEILSASSSRDRTQHVARQGGHGASAVETEAETMLAWISAHSPRAD